MVYVPNYIKLGKREKIVLEWVHRNNGRVFLKEDLEERITEIESMRDLGLMSCHDISDQESEVSKYMVGLTALGRAYRRWRK